MPVKNLYHWSWIFLDQYSLFLFCTARNSLCWAMFFELLKLAENMPLEKERKNKWWKYTHTYTFTHIRVIHTGYIYHDQMSWKQSIDPHSLNYTIYYREADTTLKPKNITCSPEFNICSSWLWRPKQYVPHTGNTFCIQQTLMK